MRGRLIVLEGIDGSGKATQAKLLKHALDQHGRESILFSFPGYRSTIFGEEIRAYLAGEYGELPPKMAATLFALDRFEQLPSLREALDRGLNVVCDRYLPSNLAHQGARCSDSESGMALIRWIKKVEAEVFGVLKPDLTILLEMPTATSQELIEGRGAKDLHEADSRHLETARGIYEMLATEEGWQRIQCVQGGGLRSPDAIAWDVLSVVLNELWGE